MIDIDLIRKNYSFVKDCFSKRGVDLSLLDRFVELDSSWKSLKEELDSLRAKRNEITRAISDYIKQGKDISELKQKSKELSLSIKESEKELSRLEKERLELFLEFPNVLHSSVPIGKDDSENVELYTYKKPEKTSSDVIPHYEMPFFDFKRGAKLGGHRFTVLKDKFAKLERAIISFALDFYTKKGYYELAVPYLVKEEIMQGTGKLPKFKEDLYQTNDSLWIIPTGEVPLVGYHSNEILEEEDLPISYTTYTASFRREAGSYGKDIKGYIRQHQFNKVELVKYTLPEDSYEHLESMLNDAKEFFKQLDIPYRVIEICSGDLGFCATKAYDIEAWLPSQDKYREIGSYSNCTDFQSRRLSIKFRRKDKLLFAHTLNGTGVAGRTLIAILENYYEDNGINIPKALVPYFGEQRIEL